MAYNQVSMYPAAGVHGAKATTQPSIYTPISPLVADEAGIAVGSFVAAGEDEGTATATISATSDIIGFAERVINYPNYDVDSEGSLVVPEGYALTVAVKGDYYVNAPATVAVGDAVMVDTAGAVASDGMIDSGWVYKTSGDEGEAVIISNWA